MQFACHLTKPHDNWHQYRHRCQDLAPSHTRWRDMTKRDKTKRDKTKRDKTKRDKTSHLHLWPSLHWYPLVQDLQTALHRCQPGRFVMRCCDCDTCCTGTWHIMTHHGTWWHCIACPVPDQLLCIPHTQLCRQDQRCRPVPTCCTCKLPTAISNLFVQLFPAWSEKIRKSVEVNGSYYFWSSRSRSAKISCRSSWASSFVQKQQRQGYPYALPLTKGIK